jgi:hypothetical protein
MLRYPLPGSGVPDTHDYPAALLAMALGAADWPALVTPTKMPMVQARWLIELDRPLPEALVDVVWTMSTPELEARFLPVRVPIFKGLFGWRVLLVRKAERLRFAQVRSLADFKGAVFGQGQGWPDTDILRANGLRVRTAAQPSTLVNLLLNGQIDAFPRGVAELHGEMERLGHLLALEPSLVLHYRAPMYFFVHRDRPDVARALATGLARLQATGRFDQFVQAQLASELAMAALPRRRLLALHNPLLTPETPAPDSPLWFRLPAG